MVGLEAQRFLPIGDFLVDPDGFFLPVSIVHLYISAGREGIGHGHVHIFGVCLSGLCLTGGAKGVVQLQLRALGGEVDLHLIDGGEFSVFHLQLIVDGVCPHGILQVIVARILNRVLGDVIHNVALTPIPVVPVQVAKRKQPGYAICTADILEVQVVGVAGGAGIPDFHAGHEPQIRSQPLAISVFFRRLGGQRQLQQSRIIVQAVHGLLVAHDVAVDGNRGHLSGLCHILPILGGHSLRPTGLGNAHVQHLESLALLGRLAPGQAAAIVVGESDGEIPVVGCHTKLTGYFAGIQQQIPFPAGGQGTGQVDLLHPAPLLRHMEPQRVRSGGQLVAIQILCRYREPLLLSGAEGDFLRNDALRSGCPIRSLDQLSVLIGADEQRIGVFQIHVLYTPVVIQLIAQRDPDSGACHGLVEFVIAIGECVGLFHPFAGAVLHLNLTIDVVDVVSFRRITHLQLHIFRARDIRFIVHSLGCHGCHGLGAGIQAHRHRAIVAPVRGTGLHRQIHTLSDGHPIPLHSVGRGTEQGLPVGIGHNAHIGLVVHGHYGPDIEIPALGGLTSPAGPVNHQSRVGDGSIQVVRHRIVDNGFGQIRSDRLLHLGHVSMDIVGLHHQLLGDSSDAGDRGLHRQQAAGLIPVVHHNPVAVLGLRVCFHPLVFDQLHPIEILGVHGGREGGSIVLVLVLAGHRFDIGDAHGGRRMVHGDILALGTQGHLSTIAQQILGVEVNLEGGLVIQLHALGVGQFQMQVVCAVLLHEHIVPNQIPAAAYGAGAGVVLRGLGRHIKGVLIGNV